MAFSSDGYDVWTNMDFCFQVIAVLTILWMLISVEVPTICLSNAMFILRVYEKGVCFAVWIHDKVRMITKVGLYIELVFGSSYLKLAFTCNRLISYQKLARKSFTTLFNRKGMFHLPRRFSVDACLLITYLRAIKNTLIHSLPYATFNHHPRPRHHQR